MDPMSLAESPAEPIRDFPEFGEAPRRRLLAIAERSIDEGLRVGRPWSPDLDAEDPVLRGPGAAFVTLRREGQLRGCIGSLEPHRPLARDVSENAFRAAFRDPRFPPLAPHERDDLDLHLSILGPHSPIAAHTEEELVAALRAGVDGLVLCSGGHRATFLPAVWESLPDPRAFVRALKQKAGLAPDAWGSDWSFERYRTLSIP